MKEIFNVCAGDANDRMICQKCLLQVKANVVFSHKQNTCRIRHPFDLQADNLVNSFKRSDNVRFYEYTRIDESLVLSTDSRIAGKWCEQDAELEYLFALVKKRSEHIETKKQRK